MNPISSCHERLPHRACVCVNRPAETAPTQHQRETSSVGCTSSSDAKEAMVVVATSIWLGLEVITEAKRLLPKQQRSVRRCDSKTFSHKHIIMIVQRLVTALPEQSSRTQAMGNNSSQLLQRQDMGLINTSKHMLTHHLC